MQKRIVILLLGLAILLPVTSQAAVSPISVGLIPPVQFPPEDYIVTGIRASILWGKHRSVYGLDFGLIGNITDLDFAGIAVAGVFNSTYGTVNIIGLQFAGFANLNKQKTSIYGLQATLGVNSNDAASSVVGLQFALIANLSSGTKIYGLQAGIYNKALDVYGFQIGIVNSAKSLHGLQVGVLNINEAGPFKMCPILNVGF